MPGSTSNRKRLTGLLPSPCGSGSRTERPKRSIFDPSWRERYSVLFLSPQIFDQVRLDAESQTLVWPNGADFDPATLRDWPEEGPRLAALARSWVHVAH